MRNIEIGKLYQHFKGHIYKVIDIVYDCESPKEELKKVVIYQDQHNNHTKWARSYESFISEVDHQKYPDVKAKYRFEEIN